MKRLLLKLLDIKGHSYGKNNHSKANWVTYPSS
jgi:hypothetical protein